MPDKCPITSYGGQAVVEGVMMRGMKHFAVVCRRQNGEIVSTCENVENNLGKFAKLMKVPFIRGSVALVDSMILGTKALMFSADIAISDEEANKNEKENEKLKKQKEKAKEELEKSGNKVNGIFVGFSAFFGLLIGICLFMLLPVIIANFFPALKDNQLTFSIVEGLIKFIIFIAYVVGISFMPDVKRVFRYHGAEHKTINCYEDNKELTVENVRSYTTINPRCGTSFLLIFIIVSIILFIFLPTPQQFVDSKVLGILFRFLSKIILLPIVAGIAYECIKFSGKHKNSFFTRIFMKPGLLMQKITTSEPDDSMIECAIKSLQLVIEKDKNENIE